MNGIIGGVLRCQRFIHSLEAMHSHFGTQRWNRLQHLQTIKVNGYLYKTKEARQFSKHIVTRDTTDSDTGCQWAYPTGTVTTNDIGYYYG